MFILSHFQSSSPKPSPPANTFFLGKEEEEEEEEEGGRPLLAFPFPFSDKSSSLIPLTALTFRTKIKNCSNCLGVKTDISISNSPSDGTGNTFSILTFATN